MQTLSHLLSTKASSHFQKMPNFISCNGFLSSVAKLLLALLNHTFQPASRLLLASHSICHSAISPSRFHVWLQIETPNANCRVPTEARPPHPGQISCHHANSSITEMQTAGCASFRGRKVRPLCHMSSCPLNALFCYINSLQSITDKI